jgi:peptide/nickel transport system substrate-binding protein
MSKKLYFAFGLLMVASFVLSACAPAPAADTETIVETVVVTVEGEGETVIQVVTATPEPVVEAPPEPRTLVICMGQEPETLYAYGGSMLAQSSVLEAIYDGPIDGRSFDYQAVIIESIPSLADGSAVIQAVEVAPGDSLVDATGAATALADGVVYRPSGCNATDCELTYAEGGGNVMVDQMVVTFKLLPGLLWSDGTPLTAADSVYSFNLSADPDTPSNKYVIERTASYEALDDVTTVWTGLPGYIDSTYFLNMWTPYPEHIWGQYTAAELLEAEEARTTPMGWGAYVIDEWVPGDHVGMTANTNYFRASEGLPKFANVIYRFVGENSNANIAKILAGECDIADQTSHLDDQSELLLELQASGQLNATFVVGTVFEHADFGVMPVCVDSGGWENCIAEGRPDFFGDVRVRRAFVMCMDRQSVVDTVMFGQSIVLDTYLPPQHPLFNAEATHYDFDVAAGSALLDEAGWKVGEDGIRVADGTNPNVPAGTRLSVNYWTTNATQRIDATQLLSAGMAECGIETALEYWVPGEYFADGPEGPVFGRRFDIAQFAWLTGVAPPCDLWLSTQVPGEDLELYPNGWGGSNDSGWANADYDAVCNAALQSLPGQASYDENHLAAQAIFATELPVAPLYLRLKLAGTRPDMCNFIMDPTANSEMWNIEEFDYGDSCG